MKHIIGVIAFIAVITLAAWAWLGTSFSTLLPARASEEAVYVDRLFGMHLYVIAFLFALIIGFMLYSVVVFRQKAGDRGDGAYFHGNSTLEVVWTIIPLGTVLYFSVLGAQYLKEITAPEPNELVVQVISSQWNWRFDYPEYGISSSELYLPNNRQILLEISALDVIHSFWVPEFRIKQDAVPGMVKPLRITPTQLGDFSVMCAELCGKDHAYMISAVHVVEQAAFDDWVRSLTATPEAEVTLADRGRELAELNGCFKCHSIDGSAGDGPSWLGAFGEEVQLEDGSTLTADEAYLRNSILNPQEQIVAGFAGVNMPATFGRVLSEEDITAIIDFIKSLGTEE